MRQGPFAREYVGLPVDPALKIAARSEITLVGADYLPIRLFGGDEELHRVLLRRAVTIVEGVEFSGRGARIGLSLGAADAHHWHQGFSRENRSKRCATRGGVLGGDDDQPTGRYYVTLEYEPDRAPQASAKCQVTVAVCTHNGANRLPATLESLTTQRSRIPFEVLVVDNASTDSTRDLAATAPSRGVRYEFEPRLGLSSARNCALRTARGSVVCFIDDDATAMPGWVESLTEPFLDQAVGAAGGRVTLEWPVKQPRWFRESMAGLFSGVDYQDRTWLTEPEYPFGTNMAVRRDLALRLGGFRDDLGRAGSNLLSFEEFEFFRRVEQHQAPIAYVPAAVVRHRVQQNRASRRWLFRRAYTNGKSEAVMESGPSGNATIGRALFSAGLSCAYLLRSLARLPAPRSDANSLLDLTRATYFSGRALEQLRTVLAARRNFEPLSDDVRMGRVDGHVNPETR